MSKYFSGQGKVYIGQRTTAGLPKSLKWCGNVPDFKISPAVTTVEHQESYTGKRLKDEIITTDQKVSVTCTLEEITEFNLSLAFQASSTDVASGTVASGAAELWTPTAVGDSFLLANFDVSAVVVKDSAGSPATLVEGTDYSLDDAQGGQISLLNMGTFVMPLKVSYSYGAYTGVGLFTVPTNNVWIRFSGVNTADNNNPVVVDLYKVQLDPAKEFDLISNDFGSFELDGEALIDDTKDPDSEFGQFGRLVLIGSTAENNTP